jgi:tetratricopeptide (TPR) repeat protein
MNDWHDAERRFERALELVQQRKWPQALQEIRIATSINPFNGAWLFNLGLVLDEMGRHDEALEAYRQSDQIEPDNLQVLHRLGVDLVRTGRLRQSLRVFVRMSEIDPAYEPAYCHRLLAHAELGEHERAEEIFYLARLHKEHCPRCYDHMGRSLATRRSHEKAIFCFQKCLDIDPNWADARRRMAESLWNKGDLEQARRQFLADLRQNPGRTATLLDLGDLLLEMGRMDEAGEKFRRAIELAPAQAGGHWRYGHWLRLNHKNEEARLALDEALRLDPTFRGVHLELARLAVLNHDRAAARKHLRAEHFLRSSDSHILLGMANLWMDCGRYRTAIACLKRLIDQRPDNAEAWLNLGVAQFRRRFYKEGIRSCLRALKLDGNGRAGALAVYNLALAYERLGQCSTALDWTRQALEATPGDAALRRLELRLRVLNWCGGILFAARRIWGRRF